uniref:Uncharacterized protein n=1 Tax=Anguilla anguilla TaxID=7936 RepID=A0A0E9SBP6_ANGAN
MWCNVLIIYCTCSTVSVKVTHVQKCSKQVVVSYQKERGKTMRGSERALM